MCASSAVYLSSVFECWPDTDMQMRGPSRDRYSPSAHRLCEVSMKDGTSEELRGLVGFEHITTVIKSGRLRWYEHVR